MIRALFLLFSLVSLNAFSQSDSRLHKFQGFGIFAKGVEADSLLRIPSDTSVNKRGIAVKGTTLYIGNGTKWTPISGGTTSVEWGQITGTLSTQSDLAAALGLKLNISDTATMLSAYLRSGIAAATYATISNLALKLSLSDTSSMLSPYAKAATVAATYATIANLANKLNISDTSAMLERYLDTLQSHNDRIKTLSTTVEEVEERELYFGFGFEVYGIDSVQVDSSQIATLPALRDTAAALRAAIAAGGGGGGDVYLATDQTFTGKKTFNTTQSTVSLSTATIQNILFTGNLTGLNSGDTLAGSKSAPVFSGSATATRRFSYLGNGYDAQFNGVRIGRSNGTLNASEHVVIGSGTTGAALNNTGTGNLAVGHSAMTATANGYLNSAFGYNALNTNTTGIYNTALGAQAGYSTSVGLNRGTYVGSLAGGQATGSEVTALGYNAGRVSGANGVYLGHQAGSFETGTNKVYIDNLLRSNEADGRLKALMYGQTAVLTVDQFVDFNANLITNSFNTAIAAKTGAYTVTAEDHTIEATSGTFTITLPSAVGIAGREYWITNSGSGTITIATTSSQTFINVSGTPTTLSVAQFANYLVKSNGTNWIAR